MSAIKHAINLLTMPLFVALVLGVAGAICRRARWRRTATGLLASAAIVTYLGSIEQVGQWLLRPLENRYPPLQESAASPAVESIVVLGGEFVPGDGIPITAALTDDSLQRVVEAVRLMERLHIRTLVVSGGASAGQFPSAHGYSLMARDLGVDPESIVVLDGARDSGAEAHAIQHLLGSKPFLLVTSAYHMPRAMWLMRRVGAQPIAAPTGQRTRRAEGMGWYNFVPRSVGLRDSERALHEYVGLAALSAGIE